MRKNMVTVFVTAFIAVAVLSLVLCSISSPAFGSLIDIPDYTTDPDNLATESLAFGKTIIVWFMLILVAFLMLFIKKYEWGVALAVLLSAAGSFVAYLAIQDLYFGEAWNQVLLIRGAICAITLVIAIGVFLGTVKSWGYLLIGFLFAPVYALVEYFMGNIMVLGNLASDPGGSILVHMVAAYFGLGVALALNAKAAFDEPMYTTTHSVSFVWLASGLLWVLWPGFVTSLLPMDQVAWGTITCYMAGIGSIITAYITCMLVEGKVNPLVYTYALLAGPVAIGAPLLIVGPWGALVIGIVAGAVSALSFIYLQPWLCGKLGVLDVMGVHNLHGMGGWVGVLATTLILGNFTNLAVAVIVVITVLVLGFVVGGVIRLAKGLHADEDMFRDDVEFIKNEEPA